MIRRKIELLACYVLLVTFVDCQNLTSLAFPEHKTHADSPQAHKSLFSVPINKPLLPRQMSTKAATNLTLMCAPVEVQINLGEVGTFKVYFK